MIGVFFALRSKSRYFVHQRKSGIEGGILNQTFELSCRAFSNMGEHRMNTSDFHDLVYCNCFNLSA
jgi:hypothetical protein